MTQVIENILTDEELGIYDNFYHEVVNGKLKERAAQHRHDLGSHVAQKQSKVENITQVSPFKIVSHFSQLDFGPIGLFYVGDDR